MHRKSSKLAAAVGSCTASDLVNPVDAVHPQQAGRHASAKRLARTQGKKQRAACRRGEQASLALLCNVTKHETMQPALTVTGVVQCGSIESVEQ